MSDYKKMFICKDKYGEIYATNVLAQGNRLATLDELEDNQWLYERFPNSVLIVNHTT